MKHGKKMIAPIIISIIIAANCIGVAVLFASVTFIPVPARIIMTAIPLIPAAVIIGVLISRIKEIKGGEEDDLSQY